MSFESLLINTCIIERYTETGRDLYGNPQKSVDLLPSQPCRLSYPRGRQVQRGTEVVPVEAVLFMEDIVITEADRVIVDGDEFEILFVATLQDGGNSHHKELSLRRIIP